MVLSAVRVSVTVMICSLPHIFRAVIEEPRHQWVSQAAEGAKALISLRQPDTFC